MAFDGQYLDWNQKRIKGIVDFYGYKFMYMKKVLDLGCGYADISGTLHRLGADVTAVDCRPEHLKIVNKKFAGIKTIQADLDRNWPFQGKKFDIILDLGLLCHLSNYEDHLKAVCASTTHLVLETAVCDSNDPNKSIAINESKGIYDLSANGLGCRPSAAAIERVLTECGMNFRRVDDARYNASKYTYDWQSQNNDSTDIYQRRIWFAVKDSSKIKLAREPNIMPQPRGIQGITRPQPPSAPSPLLSPRFQYKDALPPLPPLPVYPEPPPSTPSAVAVGPSPVAHMGPPKVRLFYNYYVPTNDLRRREIDLCLQKNIDNNVFDIIVLDSQDRPTYDFFFQKINQLAGPNDISIFCNSDIFFDRSIDLAKGIGHKEVFVLGHWDWKSNAAHALNDSPDIQDAWIVRGKVEGVMGDFKIGLPGSSGKIAFEFQKAGYKVSNPCRTIKAFHAHGSGIKNTSENDRVPGPYLNVDPTGL